MEKHGLEHQARSLPGPGMLSPEESLYGFTIPSATDVEDARRWTHELIGFTRHGEDYRFKPFEREMWPIPSEGWCRYKMLRCAAGGKTPKRQDMHPSRMAELRDHMYIMEAPRDAGFNPQDYRYVTFGRTLQPIYKSDMTGKTLADIPAAELSARLIAMKRTLFYLDRPTIIFGRFKSMSHALMNVQWLALPLAHEDPDMQAMVCVTEIEEYGTPMNLFAL